MAGAPGPNASLQLAWSPKGGPKGTLHVVAEGNDQIDIANLGHIWHWRSTDGGRTWSAPKAIDDSDKSQMGRPPTPTPSWAGTTLGSPTTTSRQRRGRRSLQDIFTAAVQYEVVGGGTSDA